MKSHEVSVISCLFKSMDSCHFHGQCVFFSLSTDSTKLYETLPLPSKVSTSSHLRKFRESLLLRTWSKDTTYAAYLCFVCYKFSQIFVTLCLSKVPLFAANKLWRKHLRRSLSISWRSTTSSTCEAVPAWVCALRMRPNDLMSTKSKQFQIDTQNSTHQPSWNFQELAGMCLRANRSRVSAPTLGGISQHCKHHGFIMIW